MHSLRDERASTCVCYMPAPAHKHDGQLILCCAHIVLTLRVIVGLARAVDTVELAVVEHTVVHLPTVLAAVRVRTRTGRVVTVMAKITITRTCTESCN